ncbi:hypothetical protein ABIB29_001480 [Arthrobacter sp. UYEF36]
MHLPPGTTGSFFGKRGLAPASQMELHRNIHHRHVQSTSRVNPPEDRAWAGLTMLRGRRGHARVGKAVTATSAAGTAGFRFREPLATSDRQLRRNGGGVRLSTCRRCSATNGLPGILPAADHCRTAERAVFEQRIHSRAVGLQPAVMFHVKQSPPHLWKCRDLETGNHAMPPLGPKIGTGDLHNPVSRETLFPRQTLAHTPISRDQLRQPTGRNVPAVLFHVKHSRAHQRRTSSSWTLRPSGTVGVSADVQTSE